MARPTRIARRLRRDATLAERRLWLALGTSELPVRFRRQHPIGAFIADFACPAIRLAIEIDGGQHATNAEPDAARTKVLPERGYRVVRFWNNDVMDNLASVLETIHREVAAARPTSPRPSPP